VEASFLHKEEVYIDTNILIDYVTCSDQGAYAVLQRYLRGQNCKSYVSTLAEFEMLSVLRRKRLGIENWEKVRTILTSGQNKRIDLSTSVVLSVRDVLSRYAHILYNVVKNRLSSNQTGIREEVPERMDLYHYAIALEKGIDSLASKDKQFCNEPTEMGIIETLKSVPRLKNAKYPRLKRVSEKNEQQKFAARHPSRLEKLKQELEVKEDLEALGKLIERKRSSMF